MSFKEIACHVWAIDGYKDDDTAKRVNELYNNHAKTLRVQNNLNSRREALQSLVNKARQSDLTDENITVYGGFRRNQNAPEHMWIEYKNKIYETMPDRDLCVVDATAAYRACPPLEGEEFGANGVASIAEKLTVNQRGYLASLE